MTTEQIAKIADFLLSLPVWAMIIWFLFFRKKKQQTDTDSGKSDKSNNPG